MTSEQGFKLHPEAARDITDIWEYIAEENPFAAGVCARISWMLSANLYPSHIKVTNEQIRMQRSTCERALSGVSFWHSSPRKSNCKNFSYERHPCVAKLYPP